MQNRSFSDAGGTPGGLGHFLLGLVMTCIGGYLFVNQVTVVGSYWSFYGGNSFGITLLPLLFGIGILFWRGRSILGWILTIAGALFIFAGIIANLHIFFRPMSLFNTLVMLVLYCRVLCRRPSVADGTRSQRQRCNAPRCSHREGVQPYRTRSLLASEYYHYREVHRLRSRSEGRVQEALIHQLRDFRNHVQDVANGEDLTFR